jgi:GNAT superfamily N-acetyltransferase
MQFALRTADQADYARIVAIVNAQIPGSLTLEEMIRQEQLYPAGDPKLRLVAAADDGRILGSAVASGGSMQPPGYFRVNTRVDAPYQGQGIGSALYRAVEAFAREHGATRLDSAVREVNPADRAWAERRGFVMEYHMFESVLDLSRFDPAPFTDAVARVRQSGIRFTTMAEESAARSLSEDEAFRLYWELAWPVVQDQPGMPPNQPEPPYEVAKKATLEDPQWHPSRVILAVDGDRWVAFADVTTRPDGDLYNHFTGVRREYRGQGLSLATKVVALEHAKRLGAPRIRTNNHSQNAPMLATNRRLGYVPEPGFFSLYKLL